MQEPNLTLLPCQQATSLTKKREMKILKAITSVFIYVNNYIPCATTGVARNEMIRKGVTDPTILMTVAKQQVRDFDATMSSQV